MSASHPLDRQIQQALYRLKRDFGGTIDIYSLQDAQTDARTGVKTIDKTVTRIERAVVLPAKISRAVEQSISLISANKAFVYGGSYDAGTRVFIVDRRDAPELRLTKDDWIVYRRRKYEIKAFQDFAFHSSWVITAKTLIGEIPEQILPADAESRLEADHDMLAGFIRQLVAAIGLNVVDAAFGLRVLARVADAALALTDQGAAAKASSPTAVSAIGVADLTDRHLTGMRASTTATDLHHDLTGLKGADPRHFQNLMLWMPAHAMTPEYRWQNAAKTIPANAPGDRIRVLTDRSLSSRDCTAPSNLYRPALDVEGLVQGRPVFLWFGPGGHALEVVNSQSAFNFVHATGVFTITGFIQTNVLGTNRLLLANNGGGQVTRGFSIVRTNGNAIRLRIGNGTTAVCEAQLPGSPDDKFHFFAFRGNGSQVDGWFDSAYFPSLAVIGPLGTGNARIMRFSTPVATVFGDPWNGGIDDLTIYNAALTDQQVAELAAYCR